MHQHIVNIDRIQFLSIIGSILFFIWIIELIRRKKLKESFSLIWVFFGIVFIVFSAWRRGLELVATAFGIDYAPSALFVFLISGIILLLLQFSILISKFSEQIKLLCQEIGILKMEIKRMQGERETI